MSNASALFLGDRNQIAFFADDCLCISAENPNPLYVNPTYADYLLVSRLNEPSLLAACAFGVHFAFWSLSDESFRLVDMNGQQIWSAWMNSDKSVPKRVRFSACGDAVACEYRFDGLPGLFFCDYWTGYTTSFGCSGTPIGYDTNLQYFAIDNCDPFEEEKMAFFRLEPNSGNPMKIPPEEIARILEQRPLLVDRYRRFIDSPVIPLRKWQALSIKDDLAGFVILKDGDLNWFDKDNTEPVAVKHCHAEKERWDWFHAALTLYGDNVLVKAKNQAMVVNKATGIVWQERNLISSLVKGHKILARYENGAIKVFRLDGSLELEYQSPKGFHPITATIRGDTLVVACEGEMSGNIVFKTAALHNADS